MFCKCKVCFNIVKFSFYMFFKFASCPCHTFCNLLKRKNFWSGWCVKLFVYGWRPFCRLICAQISSRLSPQSFSAQIRLIFIFSVLTQIFVTAMVRDFIILAPQIDWRKYVFYESFPFTYSMLPWSFLQRQNRFIYLEGHHLAASILFLFGWWRHCFFSRIFPYQCLIRGIEWFMIPSHSVSGQLSSTHVVIYHWSKNWVMQKQFLLDCRGIIPKVLCNGNVIFVSHSFIWMS